MAEDQMDNDLVWMSAGQLHRLIVAHQLSPVEVVEACLARIEQLEPTLHAFITVAADRALEDAHQAEGELHRGGELGPLHGIPVALKDEAWTAGIPSTAGSLLFKRFVPGHHGTVTERLERAGAIVIGKTNMPEFAAWPRSKSRLAGESVNPWDVSRISGASSGGSAAAVAAGMVPLAIGSDGGGFNAYPVRPLRRDRSVSNPGPCTELWQFQLQPGGQSGAHRPQRLRRGPAPASDCGAGPARRHSHAPVRPGRAGRPGRGH